MNIEAFNSTKVTNERTERLMAYYRAISKTAKKNESNKQEVDIGKEKEKNGEGD